MNNQTVKKLERKGHSHSLVNKILQIEHFQGAISTFKFLFKIFTLDQSILES